MTSEYPSAQTAYLASIAAGISAISGGGLSYKGKDRTTTTGAAEELTIPADSTKAIITCAPDSDGYIEVNGNASTSSPVYINELTPLTIELGGVTKLSAWVLAGNIGVVFFG